MQATFALTVSEHVTGGDPVGLHFIVHLGRSPAVHLGAAKFASMDSSRWCCSCCIWTPFRRCAIFPCDDMEPCMDQ